MNEKLSAEQFKTLAKTARRVTIYQELDAGKLSPMDLFLSMENEISNGAFLESGMEQGASDRYSILAFDKENEFKADITEKEAFLSLKKLSSQLSSINTHPLCALSGNAIGYITYDAVRLIENIPNKHADIITQQLSLPTGLFFNFYRCSIIYAHHTKKIIIFVTVDIPPSKKNLSALYQKTEKKIKSLVDKIFIPINNLSSTDSTETLETPLKVDIELDDHQYAEIVEKAKEYIRAGDIFQVVLSRAFTISLHTNISPTALYQTLRKVNPSPYMFYLPMNGNIIIGASPEKLVSVNHKQVSINPIAGSSPRAANASSENDQTSASKLLNDPKERSEHIMLVDLARNDLGKICEPGSVEVKDLLKVKHFSHISHITSTVVGKLSHEYDEFDALQAAFPAGTLSGAPKIRAMEIIDELEKSARGLYGGAICRLDNQGNLDSCIAIRMGIIHENKIHLRAGGGIVMESDPYREADETRQKAQALITAIAHTIQAQCHAHKEK